jgi:hypothetical protein
MQSDRRLVEVPGDDIYDAAFELAAAGLQDQLSYTITGQNRGFKISSTLETV